MLPFLPWNFIGRLDYTVSFSFAALKALMPSALYVSLYRLLHYIVKYVMLNEDNVHYTKFCIKSQDFLKDMWFCFQILGNGRSVKTNVNRQLLVWKIEKSSILTKSIGNIILIIKAESYLSTSIFMFSYDFLISKTRFDVY